MKDRGCDWTGTLEQLDSHLDLNCQYVDVECLNKCEQPIQKHHLPTHLTNECIKRNFFCQYCNFKATYEVVCYDHWPQCPFYPVPCPNGCEIMAIERGDLDAHLMLCSLEVVECDFSYAGCNVKLVRDKMERHLADNLQRHILMMNKALQEKIEEKEMKIEQLESRLEEKDRLIEEQAREQDRLIHNRMQELQQEKDGQIQKQVCEQQRTMQELQKENDRKIQQQTRVQERKIQELREEKDRQVQKLQEVMDGAIQKQAQDRQRIIRELQQEIQEEVRKHQRQIQELQKTVKEEQEKQTQTQAAVARVEAQLATIFMTTRIGTPYFTLNGFQVLKSTNGRWDSPPLCTHLGGCTIGITVLPNGHGLGAGTHVSVFLYRAIGENDYQLTWPADCTVTLQLLNQHRDQDHFTVRQVFRWCNPGETTLWEFQNCKFIAHKDLAWNAEKQTQYLKNDSLQFRIRDVQVLPTK